LTAGFIAYATQQSGVHCPTAHVVKLRGGPCSIPSTQPLPAADKNSARPWRRETRYSQSHSPAHRVPTEKCSNNIRAPVDRRQAHTPTRGGKITTADHKQCTPSWWCAEPTLLGPCNETLRNDDNPTNSLKITRLFTPGPRFPQRAQNPPKNLKALRGRSAGPPNIIAQHSQAPICSARTGPMNMVEINEAAFDQNQIRECIHPVTQGLGDLRGVNVNGPKPHFVRSPPAVHNHYCRTGQAAPAPPRPASRSPARAMTRWGEMAAWKRPLPGGDGRFGSSRRRERAKNPADWPAWAARGVDKITPRPFNQKMVCPRSVSFVGPRSVEVSGNGSDGHNRSPAVHAPRRLRPGGPRNRVAAGPLSDSAPKRPAESCPRATGGPAAQSGAIGGSKKTPWPTFCRSTDLVVVRWGAGPGGRTPGSSPGLGQVGRRNAQPKQVAPAARRPSSLPVSRPARAPPPGQSRPALRRARGIPRSRLRFGVNGWSIACRSPQGRGYWPRCSASPPPSLATALGSGCSSNGRKRTPAGAMSAGCVCQ